MTPPADMPAALSASAADDALHRLWMDFVEASTRAQRTLVYADGMAAREAWGRFMTGYAPPRPTSSDQPSQGSAR